MQLELHKDPKFERTIPQEIATIEAFPEKV